MKNIFTYLFLFHSFAAFTQQSKIDSLLSALKIKQTDTTRVNTLNAIATAIYSSKPDSAILLGQQSAILANKINFKKGEAEGYSITGVAYWTKGDYDKALENHFIALKIDEGENNKSGVARRLGNIGIVYNAQGDYPKTLEYYLKALKIAQELGDKKRIAVQLGNIGIVYRNQGDYPKALDYFFKSMKLNEELQSKSGIANNLGNMGIVYDRQDDNPKALDCYFKALKLDQEIENKSETARQLGSIGNVYWKQHNYTNALEYFFKALKIDEEVGNKSGIARHLCNIGNVSYDQQDYPKALEYYLKALKIVEETGSKNARAIYLGNIGSVYIKQNKLNEADKFLHEALQIAEIKGELNLIKDDNLYLSELYSKKGNWKMSMEHYKKYIVARDSLINEENTKKTVQTQMQYEFDKKESLTKAEQDKKDAVTAEEKRRQKVITYSVSGGLFLVLMLALFIFRGYRQKQKANKELAEKNFVIEEQKKLVEEKNKDITDSINYAQRIQRALLASDNLLNKNLGEYFVFFKPKDIVSGDFYWATEKDGRFYLAVCDSTGHGVPGAFMSLLNISFLNEAIVEKGIKQPNEVFNHVRQRLIENISTDGAKDGMDGILVCFDKSKKVISYAGANNAPMLMDGTLQELATDNMPVGLGEKKDSFTHNTISFQAGNILYLYTDGFADQFGGPKGKKFKYKPLNEILVSISEMSMAEQRNTLEHTFVNWKGNLEQVDDVLVIGVKL